MISVAEARARILAALSPLPTEIVGLPQGAGRILRETLHARLTQPPQDASAMDGYAVRSADTATPGSRLKIVGQVPAGQLFDRPLRPGECVRIFTGAFLPEGADAIAIQEDCIADGDQVQVGATVRAGTFVRPAGLDFRAGDPLLHPGHRLNARDIGIAAAMNRPWLPVTRRPRVGILATGDEIVLPGEPVGPAQIVSSNAFLLAAMIRSAGGEPIDLGIAPDERPALDSLVGGLKGLDLLVTTGGASVGDHDLVRDCLEEHGARLDFWKIAMRPGKPLFFGRLADVPVLGLPGNPVSTCVCAQVFLIPALARLLGWEKTLPAERRGRLAVDLQANDRREDYLRSELEAGPDEELPLVRPFRRQDSSMLALLARSSALVVRAPHAPPAAAGDLVTFLPFMDGLADL